MLERVEIRRFRSCVDVVIDGIPQVLALVGRNGAGKTNILQGIAWASGHAVGRSADPEMVFFEASVSHVVLDVRLSGKLFRYEVRLGLEIHEQAEPRRIHEETVSVTNPDGESYVLLSRTGDNLSFSGSQARKVRISSGMPCLVAAAALTPDEPVVLETRALHRFLSKVTYNALDELNTSGDPHGGGIIEADAYTAWRASSPRSDSIPMRLIEAHRERPEAFKELRELLGRSGLDLISPLVVSEIKVPRPKNKTSGEQEQTLIFVTLRPSQGPSDGLFRYNDLSLGTRRVLRVLVSLVLDDNSLLLLEQPEDSIHQALLRKLISLLKTYSAERTAVIVASHSPVVLNSMTPAEVRLVTIEKGRTAARALNAQELAAAKGFMDREGPFAEFLESVEE